MRVIYKEAEQGHAIPSQVLEARGPFQPWNPEVIREDPEDPFPPGATAQNGMQEVAQYMCRACGATVTEYQLDSHRCEGDV